MSSPQVQLAQRSKKIQILEEIAKAYQTQFPDRHNEILRMVQEARQQVATPDATSLGGTMQWKMRLPTELVLFVNQQMQKRGAIEPDENFWTSRENADLVFQVWPDLRVSKGRSKQLYG